MKTEAAVLTGHEHPLHIEDLRVPTLKAGQVLVKVAYSGVCHSQLNEIRGLKGEDRFLPHTLGHEGAGVVEDIGADVTKVKPGDHVVLTWIQGSGLNVSSAQYETGAGAIVNSGAISTFMTYAIVSENRVVRIPETMPLRTAALLGCAVPTGAGIILNAGLQAGCTVAVFGAGGIGLSAIMAARLIGAEKIIAIDVFDHKLELARKFGATDTVNAGLSNAESAIMEGTGGRGIDCAVESAGRRETMETAFRVTKDNGGLCVLAGNLPHGQLIKIDPFGLIKGKRLTGSWGGSTDPDRDVPKYVEHYLSGKMDLDLLITHQYSLGDINSAFSDLEQGRIGRALIELEIQQR